MKAILPRIEAGGRGGLLAGAALLAPAALMPESFVCAILNSIAATSVEAIAAIAAAGNALTLIP